MTEDEKPKYLNKFRKFVNHESFFGYMVGLVSPKESLAVLCHGDCWTNNFLFQYTQDGSISEVRRDYIKESYKCKKITRDWFLLIFKVSMVDFQLARYGSPALDLVSLLYCCTSVELRKQYLPELLEEYYDSIVNVLTQTSCLNHYPDIRQK